jgi:hypothetical protein
MDDLKVNGFDWVCGSSTLPACLTTLEASTPLKT